MNQTLVYTLWLWKESYKKKEFAPSDFVAKGVIMDFYGIFVYMRRGAGVLSFICRDGAFGRIVVASSMDRNYRGAISPSQRARSASGYKKAFLFPDPQIRRSFLSQAIAGQAPVSFLLQVGQRALD